MRSRNWYHYVADPSNRVLIVAPSEYDKPASAPALPHQYDEVSEALRAFYEPVPLLGRVTERQLADELRTGAGGFWFIGHAQSGPAGGLLLSDGLLSARDLGRYLGRAGVQWSYLNTCDSGAFVTELQAVHPHDVFANIVREVADVDAARNGVQMAQGIADSGSILKAYRWVVSGGPSVLRMFPSPDGAGVIRERDSVVRASGDDRLRRLEQTVYGDSELGLMGLAGQYKRIQTDLRIIKWLAGLAFVGALMYGALQLNQPEPRTVIIVATPTATYAPYVPPEIP